MNLFGHTVRRPVALLVAFVTLLVIGAIAYVRIPLQLMPSGWSENSVMIWAPNPGASARDNEENVARVIEDELKTLQGIRRLRSTSREDIVMLRVSFQPSVDMNLAKAEVRDRIERATPKLPTTIEPIGMWSESSGDLPLAFFSVTHLGDSDETDFLLDEVVKPMIESADGVSQVEVWGSLQDTVRIQLDEERVAGTNLDVMGLIQGLSSDNFADPLGEVVDGGTRTILRTDMRFESPEEIAAYPLANGLVLGDVANVRRSKSVRDQITRVDGRYAYFGVADKESTANVVEASRNFLDKVEALRSDPRTAGKIDFVPFFVQGDLIEASLEQLMTTAAQGGFLAAIVLLLFLRRFRITLCIAGAIPVSALLSIAFEHFTGGSFNILTMVGMTLAIGMLVDNAVVVVENIVRVRPECSSDLEAAAVGAREIALPVTLATLTTVVVFLPVIFMGDNPVIKVMLGSLGMPLCTALISSLLIAVVFLPVITARVMTPQNRVVRGFWRVLDPVLQVPARALAYGIGAVRLGFHGFLRVLYPLERAALAVLVPLRWPLALGVLGAAVWFSLENRGDLVARAILDGSLSVPAAGALSSGLFLPRLVPALLFAALVLVAFPRGRAHLRAARAPQRPHPLVPPGHSLIAWLVSSNQSLVTWTLRHRTAAIVLSALAFVTIAVPMGNVKRMSMDQGEEGSAIEVGVRFQADFTLAEASRELAPYEAVLEANKEEWGFAHWRNSFDESSANISFFFKGGLTGERRTAVLADLRAKLPDLPGHEIYFYDAESVSETSNRIAMFTLQGTDSEELARYGREAKQLLEEVQGLSGITLPDAKAPDEVRVRVQRDVAMSMGFNANNAISSINWALRGQSLPRFQERGREIPLILEYDKEDTPGMATLHDLPVYSMSGQLPLSSIAEFEVAKGESSIRRVDGRISYRITAQVDDPARINEITEDGFAALAELRMPRGFEVARDLSRRNRTDEEFGAMMNALMLSIVLVFLVMGVLFESVLLPVSVLTTIPFAVTGALWSLLLTDRVLDPMAFVGLIVLAGVVVNNGIVLIDRIHNLRRQMPRDQAVLAGCAQRVRPIVMTALTTVIGLVPMAVVQPKTDSIDYRAMGAIVIGGLLAATFFTLWVVPLAYTLLDDLSEAVRSAVRWGLSGGRGAAPCSGGGGLASTGLRQGPDAPRDRHS